MPYTNNKLTVRETPEQLRARIPGWGADSDPANRPSVPRERFDLPTGAHWDFPERQPENTPREKSIEHKFVTPVFGTSTPLKGLSGVMRRYSYARYSEARAAHWLLLLASDRVDAVESRASALVGGALDNPLTATGVNVEARKTAMPFRFSRRRADGAHDPVAVLAPWLVAVGVGAAVLIRFTSRRRA